MGDTQLKFTHCILTRNVFGHVTCHVAPDHLSQIRVLMDGSDLAMTFTSVKLMEITVYSKIAASLHVKKTENRLACAWIERTYA